MSGFPRQVLAGCLAILAGGSAAFAADPPVDEAFVYWQDNLLGKENRVVEHGDLVFVVVRVPIWNDSRAKAREKAMLESSSLLKAWAYEQTRKERGAKPRRPAAIARMEKFNDTVSPGWRIPPWRISVSGRQIPAREIGGFYCQGLVYDRKTLLAAIPETYRRHPSDEAVAAVFEALSAAARQTK